MLRILLLIALTALAVLAQDASDPDMTMDGMDGMDMGGTATGGGMTPWFHFNLGDSLWFSSWVPQSHGALAGACIGLFLLAIVERWIAALRGLMEAHWTRRLVMINDPSGNL